MDIERVVIDGDGYGKDGYRVIEIYYDSSRRISRVKIDSVGKTVFDSTSTQPKSKPTKTEVKSESKTDYETQLRMKCNSLTKDASINPNEIEKFFKHYKSILEKGWNGNKFDADALWNIWISKVK